MPYQLPMPADAAGDIVVPSAVPEDERVWVPQAENVSFRPLCLNVSQGYWVNLLRVRKSGVLSRHRHPAPVHGYVIKGRWRYLEHDWTAEQGSYVYEPPGETHTLVVPGCVQQDRDVPCPLCRGGSGGRLCGSVHSLTADRWHPSGAIIGRVTIEKHSLPRACRTARSCLARLPRASPK